MHRFFIDHPAQPGDSIVFEAPASRQMARVLRLEPGARVIAVEPCGWELIVELTEVGVRRAVGVVVGRQRRQTEPPVRVILGQGLPKHDKMDLVVQKCTEIGVADIVPVVTRRSIVRLEPGSVTAAARCERWNRIAREASEQAGRTVTPVIHPVTGLAGALPLLGNADLFLMPWEEERALGLKTVLRQRLEKGGVSSVAILIGPEGGFAPDEVDMARCHGAVAVGMGPRLLRTETASLVAASIVLYEAGDIG